MTKAVEQEKQEKKAERREARMSEKMASLKNRQKIRSAPDTKESREELKAFLKKMAEKTPDDLSDQEKTALALLIMGDNEYSWKELARDLNERANPEIPKASMFSDPTASHKDADEGKFTYSFRGALFKAQWDEDSPLYHAFVWRTIMNTKVHVRDASKGIQTPRERLSSVTMQKGVHEMLQGELDLMRQLKSKFLTK